MSVESINILRHSLEPMIVSADEYFIIFFFFQAEDGIRDVAVTGVQTCALPISHGDPPGQKTGGLRISWPASVLTRTDAKEMPAARGASYASDKFEQVRFEPSQPRGGVAI